MDSSKFFLNPHSIRAMVPAPTFERGMSLYLIQQVLRCEVTHSSSNTWDIEGEVQGTERKPYSAFVAVEIDPEGNLSDLNGTCSCPVGRNCKHAIALPLKAAFMSARSPAQATRGLQTSKQPEDKRPASQKFEALLADQKARAARVAEQKVTQWLDLLGDATTSQVAADSSGLAVTSQAGDAREDEVVYMLSSQKAASQTLLALSFGHSRRRIKAGWTLVKMPRYFEPEKMTQAARDVVNLLPTLSYQARRYASSTVGKSVLDGEAGRLAVQLASASGRLFSLPRFTTCFPFTGALVSTAVSCKRRSYVPSFNSPGTTPRRSRRAVGLRFFGSVQRHLRP